MQFNGWALGVQPKPGLALLACADAAKGDEGARYRTILLAWTTVATMIDIGVASPSAHGQAIITTEMAAISA
jgi:hypothetical protein